jgi:hypothetical protein
MGTWEKYPEQIISGRDTYSRQLQLTHTHTTLNILTVDPQFIGSAWSEIEKIELAMWLTVEKK